jgi:hypothetical protein
MAVGGMDVLVAAGRGVIVLNGRLVTVTSGLRFDSDVAVGAGVSVADSGVFVGVDFSTGASGMEQASPMARNKTTRAINGDNFFIFPPKFQAMVIRQ